MVGGFEVDRKESVSVGSFGWEGDYDLPGVFGLNLTSISCLLWGSCSIVPGLQPDVVVPPNFVCSADRGSTCCRADELVGWLHCGSWKLSCPPRILSSNSSVDQSLNCRINPIWRVLITKTRMWFFSRNTSVIGYR